MTKIKILIYISLAFLVPVLTFAEDSVGKTGAIINNPLEADSLTELLATVLDIVVQVGLVVVVFFIIFAGFKYVTARGNTSEITKAHNALMATLIGAAIVLGSYAIAKALEDTVDQLKTGVAMRLEVPNNYHV